MAKLTRKLIDALEADGREVWAWDSELRGFGVRVKPSGSKSFVLQYRNRFGRSRKFTIGPVKVLSVEEARDRARKHLVAIRDGEDPADDRAADRAAVTLRAAWERYLQDYARPKKKPSSVASDEALWNRFLAGAWAKKPVAAITRGDVRALHAKLASTPYQANRLIALLSRILTLSETDWGYREGLPNPCRGLERYREEVRERLLSEDELARLGGALRDFASRSDRLPSLAPFFALTILTGTRKGEWISAKWRDVDFERGLLILPDSKTGAKVVELPAQALAILKAWKARFPGFKPDDFVLPGRKAGEPIKHPYRAFREILEAAKIEDLRIHDLRHLFGSVSHREGASQRVVAMLLGHRQLSTTERYLQAHFAERKAAAETTAKAIEEALEGELIVSARSISQDNARDSSRSSDSDSGRPRERPRQRKPRARSKTL
jgi:integrase